jgi:septum formation protein
LLGAIVPAFEVIAADVDETLTHNAQGDASRLAKSKARAILVRFPDAIVIGSDTIVHVGERLYAKPEDAGEAIRILKELRGETHCVVTGVAVGLAATIEVETSETKVLLAAMTDQQIRDYVASGRPMDKAGAYAIQDADVPTVDRIDGCYCAVMGLPLWRLKRMLERRGVECRVPDETLAQCVVCPERNL